MVIQKKARSVKGNRLNVELVLVAVLVAESAIAVGASAFPLWTAPKALAHRNTAAVLTGIQEPEQLTLRLQASGFVPTEVRRAAGCFQLSVDNRSEVDNLTLVLHASDGTLVREMRVRGGDWNELLDLTPGSYTLSEANHSNWVCQIVIA
ncbi:MAG: hypothetical protein ABI923_09675 [bacterium]